jgi:hypothetical protein
MPSSVAGAPPASVVSSATISTRKSATHAPEHRIAGFAEADTETRDGSVRAPAYTIPFGRQSAAADGSGPSESLASKSTASGYWMGAFASGVQSGVVGTGGSTMSAILPSPESTSAPWSWNAATTSPGHVGLLSVVHAAAARPEATSARRAGRTGRI